MIKNKFNIFVVLTLTVFASIINEIHGHGMMLDPVSRSSRWRYNRSAPVNYDDNGLFCGGFGVQWFRNNGKCGLCGDDFAAPRPRDNEIGGKYGQGIITKSYIQSQKARLGIKITTNHLGFFYFNICNLDKFKVESENCFRANKIKFSDGNFKMNIGKKSGMIYPTIILPKSLNCKHCVLRWNYQAGNNWGPCGNGTSAVGCGPQENFKGCSDISILMKSQKIETDLNEKLFKRIPNKNINLDYKYFKPTEDSHSNLPLDKYLYESSNNNNNVDNTVFELKNEEKSLSELDKKIYNDINNIPNETEEEEEEKVNDQFSKEEHQNEEEENKDEVLDKEIINKADCNNNDIKNSLNESEEKEEAVNFLVNDQFSKEEHQDEEEEQKEQKEEKDEILDKETINKADCSNNDINNILNESEEKEETGNVLVNDPFSKEEHQDEEEKEDEVLDKEIINKADCSNNDMKNILNESGEEDSNLMNILYRFDKEELPKNSIDDSSHEEEYE